MRLQHFLFFEEFYEILSFAFIQNFIIVAISIFDHGGICQTFTQISYVSHSIYQFIGITNLQNRLYLKTQKEMENILKGTTITFEEKNQELQFIEVYSYHQYGCKALFQNVQTNTPYDIYILSKNLVALGKFTQKFQAILKRYQQINSKLICPILSLAEDQEFYYLISVVENSTMHELVQKREGLSEFQILYFILDFYEAINYLKSRNLFYQILHLEQIRLTSNIKLLMPFSVHLNQTSSEHSVVRYEDRKSYICPQLMRSEPVNADQVNSWNLGVFIYQLYCNKKPFYKSYGELSFPKTISQQLKKLIIKLLQKNPEKRLKLSLLLVQDTFKKYTNLPHILPNTIFYCPPTAEFLTQYDRQMVLQNVTYPSHTVPNSTAIHSNKILHNLKTAKQLQTEKVSNISNKVLAIKSFKSFKHLKYSQTSFREQKVFITEFMDLSHRFGYGYQLSTGLIGFKFNDGSEMFFEGFEKKKIQYKQKKNSLYFQYEKIPEEIEIKKKFYILDAFSKSLKSQKYYSPITNHSFPSHAHMESASNIKIQQYMKTNYAAIFLLTSQNIIQVIFIDKYMVLLTKTMILVQPKNYDKFENIENIAENPDLLSRKKYALKMAEKLFHWNVSNLQNIGPQNEKSKGKLSLKKLCSMNQLLIEHTEEISSKKFDI